MSKKYPSWWTAGLSLVLLVVLRGVDVHAGGACCVVQVAGSDRPQLAVSAVHAQSDEDVLGASRSFTQQGAVLRLSWPVAFGIGLSATGGIPVRTELSGVGSGYGGWIAGAGLSWSQRIGNSPWATGASVSVSRSEASLSGSSAWNLSELQGATHLEHDLSAKRSVHVGVRANLSGTELEHAGQVERLHAGVHPVGFAGWREGWGERVSSVLEAGFGHGFLVSLGLAFPLR